MPPAVAYAKSTSMLEARSLLALCSMHTCLTPLLWSIPLNDRSTSAAGRQDLLQADDPGQRLCGRGLRGVQQLAGPDTKSLSVLLVHVLCGWVLAYMPDGVAVALYTSRKGSAATRSL